MALAKTGTGKTMAFLIPAIENCEGGEVLACTGIKVRVCACARVRVCACVCACVRVHVRRVGVCGVRVCGMCGCAGCVGWVGGCVRACVLLATRGGVGLAACWHGRVPVSPSYFGPHHCTTTLPTSHTRTPPTPPTPLHATPPVALFVGTLQCGMHMGRFSC